MEFAWKFLFPLSVLNVAVTSIEVVVWDDGLPQWLIPVNIAIAIGLIVMLHRLLKFEGPDPRCGTLQGCPSPGSSTARERRK